MGNKIITFYWIRNEHEKFNTSVRTFIIHYISQTRLHLIPVKRNVNIYYPGLGYERLGLKLTNQIYLTTELDKWIEKIKITIKHFYGLQLYVNVE